MTHLPRWSQISVAVLSLAVGAGCVTVVPMQTASVVPKGAYRLGASSSITGYCSVSLDPGNQCNAIPLGTPTPELRLGARHGIAQGLDLGLSLEGESTLGYPDSRLLTNPRGYQLGAFVDAKKELWSRPLAGGRRELVSVGPGLGYTSLQITNRSDNPVIGVVDLALPFYFGHETQSTELVLGANYVERLIFTDQNNDGRREMLADGDFGLSFGIFGRGRTRPGVQFTYQSGLARPWGGLFNISAGITWDVGLPDETAAESPEASPPPPTSVPVPAVPVPVPANAPAPAPDAAPPPSVISI